MSYYDIFPVDVNVHLANSEEEKYIEEHMTKASNDNKIFDELQFCIVKLNLKKTSSDTYNKQVRTYFMDQYSAGRMKPLYRYDKNLQLTTVGRRVRRGIEKYDHNIFKTPQPYTPGPKFEEVRKFSPKRRCIRLTLTKTRICLMGIPLRSP